MVLKKYSIIALSCALASCGVSPNTKRLNVILNETEVKSSSRTIDWYVDNPFVRIKVLEACDAIFNEQTKGYYLDPQVLANTSAEEIKRRKGIVDSYYKKIPDCYNALQSDIKRNNLSGKVPVTIDSTEFDDKLTAKERDAEYQEELAQYAISLAKSLKGVGDITPLEQQRLAEHAHNNGIDMTIESNAPTDPSKETRTNQTN